MIKKTFKPTTKLFYQASRTIFNGTIMARIMYALSIVLPISIIALYFAIGMRPNTATLISSGGLIFYSFVILPVAHYLGAKRSLTSNPSANQEQTYTFTETGLRNTSCGVDVNIDWNKISKIKESKLFVLFYTSKNMAYFIPKDLLNAQELSQVHIWHSANG